MKAKDHVKECEEFKEALKYGHIKIIYGEPQIIGKLPKGAKAGNILTGEVYNPSDFQFNMVIRFCPFCGKRIYEGYEEILENER